MPKIATTRTSPGVDSDARLRRRWRRAGCTRRPPSRCVPAPASQNSDPSVLAALRALLVLQAVVYERRGVHVPRDVDPADDAVDRRRRRGDGIRASPARHRVAGEHQVAAVARQRQVALRRRGARPSSAAGCAPAAAVGSATGVPTSGAVGAALLDEGRASRPAVSAPVPVPTRTTRNVSALHAPVASHAFDPSVAQSVPRGRSGFVGTPFVHTSVVQASPSTGLSVSSATDVTPPLASQTAFWQLPVASGSAAVPAAALFPLQVWSPRQVRCPADRVGARTVGDRQALHADGAAADPAAVRRRARRSVGLGRMRRVSARAHVVGAAVAVVDRQVGVVGGRGDAAAAVAHRLLAVGDGVRLGGRPGRCVREPAGVLVPAHALVADRIGARAVRAEQTDHARGGRRAAVAQRAAALRARGARGLGRMRRYPVHARLVGAGVALVGRRIAVEDRGHHAADAVADVALAVAGRLAGGEDRVGRREVQAAEIADAGLLLADRVGAARAGARAGARDAACRPCRPCRRSPRSLPPVPAACRRCFPRCRRRCPRPSRRCPRCRRPCPRWSRLCRRCCRRCAAVPPPCPRCRRRRCPRWRRRCRRRCPRWRRPCPRCRRPCPPSRHPCRRCRRRCPRCRRRCRRAVAAAGAAAGAAARARGRAAGATAGARRRSTRARAARAAAGAAAPRCTRRAAASRCTGGAAASARRRRAPRRWMAGRRCRRS